VTIIKYEWAILSLDYFLGCPVSFTDKYNIADIYIQNSKSCHFLT